MTTCMKVCGLSRPLAALVLLFAMAAAGPAFAKDKKKGEWDVKGDLVGKKGKPTKDLSGIACATNTGFPRTCVIIDDELQVAQVVTLTDGTIAAGGRRLIPLIHDTFDGKPVELDGEGAAFADGYFYVIGSHGRPRSDKPPAKIKAGFEASSKLARFKLNADGTAAHGLAVSTKLATLIAHEPLFDPCRDKELENGGVTIEGVTVIGGRLYAGFRGPVVDGSAIILSASLGYLFGDQQAAAKEIVKLKLGDGRGVRDLAAYDGGMFILAGPVTSNNGVYSVYWWDGRSDKAKHLGDMPKYTNGKKGDKEKQYKPEALLPLDRNTKGVRVLLLLDSAKKGDPQEVLVPYP